MALPHRGILFVEKMIQEMRKAPSGRPVIKNRSSFAVKNTGIVLHEKSGRTYGAICGADLLATNREPMGLGAATYVILLWIRYNPNAKLISGLHPDNASLGLKLTAMVSSRNRHIIIEFYIKKHFHPISYIDETINWFHNQRNSPYY